MHVPVWWCFSGWYAVDITYCYRVDPREYLCLGRKGRMDGYSSIVEHHDSDSDTSSAAAAGTRDPEGDPENER